MKNIKKAFTLIELLVVITIIGILATGAVATYTSQIQKARDTTRINDIEAVKSGLEQFYQDKGQYPDSQNTGEYAFSGVIQYVPKLPRDPKTNEARTGSAFDYIYTVGKDVNTIIGQDFEISTTFENNGNIDNKAKKDGGSDDARLEFGLDLGGNSTNVTSRIRKTQGTMSCVTDAGADATCASEATRLVIKGN